MLWLFVWPSGVYLLDFFCSSIQFYLLLSPYLCFISLLYIDLYVLGDDALRSYTLPPAYLSCEFAFYVRFQRVVRALSLNCV